MGCCKQIEHAKRVIFTEGLEYDTVIYSRLFSLSLETELKVSRRLKEMELNF
jgi:hypothetical protein